MGAVRLGGPYHGLSLPSSRVTAGRGGGGGSQAGGPQAARTRVEEVRLGKGGGEGRGGLRTDACASHSVLQAEQWAGAGL